jgi:DNA polymerase-3 subunit epsilon
VAGLILISAFAIYYDLGPESKRHLAETLSPRAELILGLCALVMATLGVAFMIAYNLYVRGALKLAEAMHIILKANPGHRIDAAGPPELNLLAKSANELAEHSQALARDLETKVSQAKSSVEEEKHRLAALMTELSQGVLVCNIDGRILLYNESARQALSVTANGQSVASASPIGLGRSIFTVIDRSMLAHALATVETRLEKSEADLKKWQADLTEIQTRIKGLTPRQVEAFALVVTGMLDKQIAASERPRWPSWSGQTGVITARP